MTSSASYFCGVIELYNNDEGRIEDNTFAGVKTVETNDFGS